MAVRIENLDSIIVAYISGDLDHHTAKNIRQQIDLSVSENPPNELILDFSGVSFMDSAGIGLVMGRFKVMQSHSGKVVIQNPQPYIAKIMKVAGISRLADIKYTKEVNFSES